jgi:mRNA-degrading endonuclease toxin of MazEF toxin-antitoxin module
MVRIPTHIHDRHQPRPAVVATLDKYPAVITSTKAQNQNLHLILVVPLSSSLGDDVDEQIHVAIPQGEGGLDRDSYARCELITSIDKALLINPVGDGPIARSYRIEILAAVRRALGDRF